MSTINGNDNSSRQDEVVRRNREDYRQNESELVRKHQKELRRITEQHASELAQLNENHQTQMTELKRLSNESVSARDHKYQKDMDSLRALHRKQLQDTAEGAQRNLEMGRQTNARDMTDTKFRAEERVKMLNEDYERTTRQREGETAHLLTEMREEQQKAVGEYREKLNQRHAEEKEKLSNERQRELSNVESQARSYRKSAEARLRDQNIRHFQERQKASDNLEDLVAKERSNQAQGEKILRQGFKDALEDTRDRYEQKMTKEREFLDTTSNETRAKVFERINNQLRGLERENSNLKDANSRDRVLTKYQADREIENMRDAFQKNVEVAQEERSAAVDQFNHLNHKDIDKINQQNSRLMQDANRSYVERFNSQEERHKSAVDNIETDFQAQNAMNRTAANQRVRHIVEETESDKARLVAQGNLDRETQAKSHRDEIIELRSIQEQDKKAAIDRLKESIRKQEVQHEEKMSVVVAKYEKEIARLNDELVRVRRANDEDLKRLAGEMQRQHKSELDTQQIQYQEKMRKTQDLHSEELRTVNRRNQERVDQLVATTKAKL